MSDRATPRPTRRQLVGLLAGAAAVATVQWARSRRPERSAERVRPGAAVTLRCPDADAYELSFGDRPPVRVEARGGTLVVEAPAEWRRETWTALVARPLAAGRPIAEAAEVAVYTRRPLFGA